MRDALIWSTAGALLIILAAVAWLCLTPLAHAATYRQCGLASWYGPESGGITASGERFRSDGLTAAHRSLPMGTVVLVTDQRTGRRVRVRINDRGPFTRGRMLDLSRGAARRLGIIGRGVTRVCIRAPP